MRGRNVPRAGILLTLVAATLIIFLVSDPFKGLIFSQMLLSIQLPWTIFLADPADFLLQGHGEARK